MAHADDAPPAGQPAPAAPSTDNQPNQGAQANQIGHSILVVNEVDGQYGDAAPQRIAVNDDILFAEDITTGGDAKTVLEFRDGSTFELGPDSAVRIDSFIFNPEESTSHKALDVTRGVFRYVSGYVASDQDAKIRTPSGEMGIRGSVVAGIVAPDVPDFVYVGEGSATFTNGAGTSEVAAGGAIAVPSATTPPMAPSAMPPAVAAQAVDVIERHLPPRAAWQDQRTADDARLRQMGAADLVPAAEQRQREAAVVARPLPPPAARASLAGELGLLVEGNRVGLYRGGPNPRTPEQSAVLAHAARENPRAAIALQRYRIAAVGMHAAARDAGTALVIRGVGRAAPSAEVMRRVTTAAVHANPAAAAAIARHAGEAYRGPDRGVLNRPLEEHRPLPRTPEIREPHGAPQTRQPVAPQLRGAPPVAPQLRGAPPVAPQLRGAPPVAPQLRGAPPVAPQLRGAPPVAPQLRRAPPVAPQLRGAPPATGGKPPPKPLPGQPPPKKKTDEKQQQQ